MKKCLSLAVCFTALLCACDAIPEKVESSTNPEITVETLFTHDGCTVYRFRDAGRSHYFTKCKDTKQVTTIGTYSESCGKNCIRIVDENITTTGT